VLEVLEVLENQEQLKEKINGQNEEHVHLNLVSADH